VTISGKLKSFRDWLRSPVARTHGIIAGVAFTLAWLIVAIVLLPDTGPAPSVAVPAVVGLRFEEAEQKLAESGLKVALGETRPSLTAPRRYVLAQTPAAGTSVGSAMVVTLDISAGQIRARSRMPWMTRTVSSRPSPAMSSTTTTPSVLCTRFTM